jgi:hypothetical protein
MQAEKELERLQRIANDQQKKKARIEGRIDSLLDELKEEGFKSVEEAKKAIELLEKQIESKNKVFQRKLNEFKTKYAVQLAEYS